MQLPAVQVSVAPAHCTQAAAEVPQAAAPPPLMHCPPLQQPPGQLVPSQTQVPPTQCWPTAQIAWPPQLHCPPWQRSARTASQAAQLVAGAPHAAAVVPDSQRSLRQQPAGQLVASQTQPPPTQRCPAWQAAWAPQRHCPPTQASAAGPQARHTAPPLPQADVEGVLHTPLKQQPEGQLAALHPLQVPPAWQLWPAGHCWQTRPPLPQAEAALPGWH